MRIFHTVEHHVHGADSQHGLVGIKAGEQAGFEVAHVLGFHQFLFLMLADIGCTGQKKTGRAHGGVKDGILERGLHQLHHHIDDMAWSTELAVLTGSGNFTQQILINITHDVLIVHVHGVNAIHNLGKHFCCGNQEHSVLHVAAESSVLAFTYGLDEGKHIGLDVRQHLAGFKVMEHIPTEIFVFRFYAGILADHTHAVLKHFVLQGNAK